MRRVFCPVLLLAAIAAACGGGGGSSVTVRISILAATGTEAGAPARILLTRSGWKSEALGVAVRISGSRTSACIK